MKKQRYLIRATIFSLVSTVLFLGCKPNDELIIAENAAVLDADSAALLLDAAPDLSVLTFDNDAPILADLDGGSVLVSEPVGTAPFGILREVVSLEDNGDTTAVNTRPAALSQVIEEGTITFATDLDAANIQEFRPLLSGISINQPRGIGSLEFPIEFDKVILFDRDGDEASTDDQIFADGNLLFTSALDLLIDFDLQIGIPPVALSEFRLENKNTVTSELIIHGEQSFGLINRQIPVADIAFQPITFFVGPIPIVLVPRLFVNLSVQADLEGTLDVTVNAELSANAALAFQDGVWGTELDADAVFSGSTDIFGAAAFRGDAELGLSLALYDIVGVEGGGNIFARANAEFNNGETAFEAFAGYDVFFRPNVAAFLQEFPGVDDLAFDGPECLDSVLDEFLIAEVGNLIGVGGVVSEVLGGFASCDGDIPPGNNGDTCENGELDFGEVCFASPLSFPAGDTPFSLTAGDFDSDSSLDLAVANFATDDVRVFFNGEEGVSSSESLAVGQGPRFVVNADLDGDDSLDLVAVNSEDEALILLNDGTGKFSLNGTVPVGTTPEGVAIGDIDGDLAPDIAVSNKDSNSVTLLFNNGIGQFTAQSAITVGDSPRSVVLTDINNDGTLDLITANNLSNDASLLLNDGQGNFTALTPLLLPDGPEFVTANDLDNDGDIDLAVANIGSDNLSILLNDGEGTFSSPKNFSVGKLPELVTAVDMNQDLLIDLVVVNFGADTISVLLNLGDGDFASQFSVSIGDGPFPGGEAPRAVVAGDFDGDLLPDLAIAGSASNDITLLLNTP